MATDKIVQAVPMALSQEDSMNLDNMAAAMYSERVADDTTEGRADVYEKNPDARQLYFKGVHDMIMAMNAWVEAAIDPNLLNLFLEKLHDQTCEDLLAGGTRAH